MALNLAFYGKFLRSFSPLMTDTHDISFFFCKLQYLTEPSSEHVNKLSPEIQRPHT